MFPTNAPTDNVDPVQEICSVVIGPELNGVSGDCNSGSAGDTQPIVQPKLNINRFTARKKKWEKIQVLHHGKRIQKFDNFTNPISRQNIDFGYCRTTTSDSCPFLLQFDSRIHTRNESFQLRDSMLTRMTLATQLRRLYYCRVKKFA